MDKLIPALYAEYGKYINEFRAFPSILDGAKLVERRLLYSLYEVARQKSAKSATVVGHCIGHYHPHGDVSCYQSLVTMVHNGLAIGQGGWGTDVGVDSNPAAAQRYTEVKCNPKILDLAFEYIKTVPFNKVELDFDEPLFLPTRLPICLIGAENYCEGIGFGYSTKIPIYDKKDLIKRLEWILNGKNGKGPIIRPITDCDYISDDSEFEKLLTKGKSKILLKGKFRKEGRNSIVVTSIPPSRTFAFILKKFEKELQVEKSLGWQDESKTSTRVRFTIIKPRTLNMDKLYKKMKKVLDGSITFDCNVCNQKGKVVTLSIDTMLHNVYKVYSKVVAKVLNDDIQSIDDKVTELNFIETMKPLLRTELKTNPDNVELAIEHIAERMKVPQKSVKEVFDKFTVSRIFKVKTETGDLLAKKTELQSKLNNITEYIWKEKYCNDL